MGFILTTCCTSHVMGHGSGSEGGSLLERQPAASLTWVVAHQGSQVPQGYSGNASFKGKRSVSGQVQRKVTWVCHKAMICCQLQSVDLSLQEPVLTPSLGTHTYPHHLWNSFWEVANKEVKWFIICHDAAFSYTSSLRSDWATDVLRVVLTSCHLAEYPACAFPSYSTSRLHCCLW